MRKVIQAFCLFLCTALVSVQFAQAANGLAANTFNSIGGTTTIDRGGAMHSQARSIYSLGGGMTSFEGKRVTLLAVDPPSFSAGCNGISWHFGGFAFISLDEIRQLVESVAQASLGLAVDLAMQTLCPQCYAVMAKLRDMSNLMRNAAYDSCKIAQSLLTSAGFTPPTKRVSKCSEASTESGKTSSWLDAAAGQACKLLGDSETALAGVGASITNFLSGNAPTGTSTPSASQLADSGNVTYQALGALGYEDGLIKDILLSLTGMTIYNPTPAADCRSTFANLYASAKTIPMDDNTKAEDRATLNSLIAKAPPAEVKASSDTDQPTPLDATVKPATPSPAGTTKGQAVCYAPPIFAGLKQSVGQAILCGFNPIEEAKVYAANYYDNTVGGATALEKLKGSSLGVMCAKTMTNQDELNPLVYTCRKSEANCLQPKMARLKDVMPSDPKNGYTGIAWMIGDALQRGVRAVRDNTGRLPPDTIAILNGSGWPLYRLINMAAVYPTLAGSLLDAYTAAIANQYAMDTLDKLVRVGGQPSIDTKSMPGLRPQDITPVREQIMALVKVGNETKTEVLGRLAEKRQLVSIIMEVNKTLQSEVIGQGLSGNASLAASLKRHPSWTTSSEPKP